MKRTRLSPGKYVEIKENINAIPSGVYRLESIVDGSYCFTVGSGQTPCFMIFGDVKHLLRPLPHSEGKKRKTPLSAFIDNYYDLLETQKNSSPIFDPTAPFSCAFLSPEHAREVN
ncbi:MAG: hypothetical protein KDD70_05730 [Bdellovibrionales bacterium]|nr:hypothetical protein [Bdellovibrionales bacterium]